MNYVHSITVIIKKITEMEKMITEITQIDIGDNQRMITEITKKITEMMHLRNLYSISAIIPSEAR